MRQCYKCKETKELTEFHNDRTQVGGKSYDCKKCKSEIRKQKRKEDPEKYREQCRKSAIKNYDTIKVSQKKHRLKNRETILKRRREQREPRKRELNAKESLRRKAQRKNDPIFLENERRKQREYYHKNREKLLPKHYAHKLVLYAIKLGMMQKQKECQKCRNNIRVEAHHEDYAKPLEVQWLCKVCHVARHKELDG